MGGTRMPLADELHGTRCKCGKVKGAGFTFCRQCYFCLPVELRRRLYKSKGYEQTYREARAYMVNLAIREKKNEISGN